MAAGSGLGGVVMTLIPLVGLMSVFRTRRRRKSGQAEPVDEEFEKRQAATRETERRMRAYLASRDHHKE